VIRGSCLCNAVRFEIDRGEILLFNNCYCTRCRKNTGTAHTAQLQVAAGGFRWRSGEAAITRYPSAPGVYRSFCATCGSRVPQLNSNGLVAVPAGLLDEDPGLRAEINMHVESKPAWATIDASVPSIPGQGDDAFWRRFMQTKLRGGA